MTSGQTQAGCDETNHNQGKETNHNQGKETKTTDEVLDIDPEAEAVQVEKAQECRNQGNKCFRETQDFEGALQHYIQATKECPPTRPDLLAVYWGNVSACQFQLKQYKETVESCEKALKLDDTHTKARIRRVKANEQLGTWGALDEAVSDLKKLQDTEGTTEQEKRGYEAQIQRIMPVLKAKQQEETQKVLGQLKDMGNSFLGKFGMSLDNFKMKEGADGSYSMNYGS